MSNVAPTHLALNAKPVRGFTARGVPADTALRGKPMATDIFLKIDGICGEARDAAHRNEIEVISCSWSMMQSGSSHRGSGSAAAKVSVRDLRLVKYVDAASAPLIKACCSGTHFKSARLTFRKAGGIALEYFTLDLKDGLIASVRFGGSLREDRLTENITLNFAAFRVEYTPQAASGGRLSAVNATWSIAKNADIW